ncbi:hypothetical protein BGZ83_008694 [Gryganskiella cystojenkinii]|nr:hypothetical protein BGZ83_008694 [Gryganskiella cystojenkinii]
MPLIGSIQNKLKSLANESILNHMQLIQTPETGPLKYRAVSAAMIIVNKVLVDDAMIYGNWSSTAIVDKFYRLSRSTANNFPRPFHMTPEGVNIDNGKSPVLLLTDSNLHSITDVMN